MPETPPIITYAEKRESSCSESKNYRPNLQCKLTSTLTVTLGISLPKEESVAVSSEYIFIFIRVLIIASDVKVVTGSTSLGFN